MGLQAFVGVYPEVGAEVGADFCLRLLQGNAGRVGDFDDRLEDGDHGGGVHHGFVAEGCADRVPPCGEVVGVGDRGFRERQQEPAVRHAALRLGVDRGSVLVGLSSMRAAPTEQNQMAGRSIETSVEGGYARGEQLDLRMGYCARLFVEFPQERVGQIHGVIEIEKADDAFNQSKLRVISKLLYRS